MNQNSAEKYSREAATIYRLFTSHETEEGLLYAMRAYSLTTMPVNYYRELYQNGLGLWFRPNSGGPPEKVRFPDAPEAIGEDILVRDNKILVLANEKVSDNEFVVSVQSSSSPEDTQSWREEFRFKSKGRAKSFEAVGDTFFFGLGADSEDDPSAAGELWKLEL